MLHGTAAAITLFLTALLFGSMLFFAAIVTPAAFKALDKEHSGRYLQILFPRFYTWGVALSILTVVSAKLISWAVAAPMVLVALSFVYGRQWLMPKINHYRIPARIGDAQAQQKFKQLHGLSVLIHLAQMGLLLTSFLLAWRAV